MHLRNAAALATVATALTLGAAVPAHAVQVAPGASQHSTTTGSKSGSMTGTTRMKGMNGPSSHRPGKQSMRRSMNRTVAFTTTARRGMRHGSVGRMRSSTMQRSTSAMVSGRTMTV
jgi:hypothetical protein